VDFDTLLYFRLILVHICTDTNTDSLPTVTKNMDYTEYVGCIFQTGESNIHMNLYVNNSLELVMERINIIT
jgi:hypothetical protein